MTDLDAGQLLAREVGRLLAPLRAAADDPLWRARLLDELGWNLDGLTGFPVAKLEQLLGAVHTAADQLAALADQPTADLAVWRALLTHLRRCFDEVRELRRVFDGWSGVSLPDAPALGTELINWLLITYLRRHRPTLGAVLWALGLAEAAAPSTTLVIDPDSKLPVRYGSAVPRLRLDRLPELLRDPIGLLRARYLGPEGLSTRAAADAAADRILPALAGILNQLGAVAKYGLDIPGLGDSAEAARHFLHAFVRTAANPGGDDTAADAGFRLTVGLAGGEDANLGLMVVPTGSIALSREDADGRVDLTADLQAAGVIAVGPDGLSTDLPDGSDPRIRANLAVTRTTTGTVLRVGSSSGTRLEVEGPVALTAFADLSTETQDFGVEVSSGAARLIVAGGDGDGFLRKVLPEHGRLDFPMGIGWSRKRGWYLRGAAALTARFDVGARMGEVARLDEVQTTLSTTSTGVTLLTTASGKVALGPITATVDGVGLGATLDFPDGGGNLGPADLDLRFQPPRGLALRMDGEAVTGAGFLAFDAANAKYAGGFDLELAKLRLSAVGLLATRLPDGRPGFSLLVIINAQFPTPIPLGFGFNLASVGGLVGINRAADVDRLRAGLRTGSLGAIMAPGDAIGNERRLLDDLDGLFPVTPGRHIFGPTARLTWGTPTVISMDLALALELPKPLRFLAAGRVRVLLPDERQPIVEINMDSLGVLDTGAGTLALDATLYDSQLAGWQLSGDMALRARWSGRSEFVLSAGGFHPRFQPPANFPALRRIALAIGKGDLLLRMESYLALTANTLQLGARVEVHAKTGDFTARGDFTFDALVRFAPFGFELDASLIVAVRWRGRLLLGIHADLHLTGPGRWHVRGQYTINVLFLKAHKRFSESFGRESSLPAPPAQDVAALVRAALAAPGAWRVEERAALPAVTLRAGIKLDGLLVSPSARVEVRQKVAPVGGMELDRFGQASISGDRSVWIEAASLGAIGAALAEVRDEFAPGQFFELSDDERLGLPSFDLMPSGVSFTATDAISHDTTGPAPVVISYQTLVVTDPQAPARALHPLAGLEASLEADATGDWTPSAEQVAVLARGGAAGRAATRTTGLARFDAPGLPISVRDPEYLVVSAATLRPAGPKPEAAARWSRTQAADQRRRWLAAHPTKDALIVVPAHEAVTESLVNA